MTTECTINKNKSRIGNNLLFKCPLEKTLGGTLVLFWTLNDIMSRMNLM